MLDFLFPFVLICSLIANLLLLIRLRTEGQKEKKTDPSLTRLHTMRLFDPRSRLPIQDFWQAAREQSAFGREVEIIPMVSLGSFIRSERPEAQGKLNELYVDLAIYDRFTETVKAVLHVEDYKWKLGEYFESAKPKGQKQIEYLQSILARAEIPDAVVTTDISWSRTQEVMRDLALRYRKISGNPF
jgi:hypothetical protein